MSIHRHLSYLSTQGKKTPAAPGLPEACANTVATVHPDGLRHSEALTPKPETIASNFTGRLRESQPGFARLVSGNHAAPVTADELVFLDLETTGLDRGAGTLAVVAGLAVVNGDALTFHQYFLSDPSCERAFLEQIAAHLSNRAVLVTYNGKSFDWPLLRSRAILQRIKLNTPTQHVDILHWLRRWLKDQYQSLNLGTAERELLGRERFGDIPGAEVPGRYWSYLKRGEPSEMIPVLSHNRTDVLSLAELFCHLCEALASPHLLGDALGAVRVAKGFKQSDRPFFVSVVDSVASSPNDGAARVAALVEQGRARLQDKEDWSSSVASLYAEFQRGRALSIAQTLQLCRWLEHRFRDFNKALEVLDTLPSTDAHLLRQSRLRSKHAAAQRLREE